VCQLLHSLLLVMERLSGLSLDRARLQQKIKNHNPIVLVSEAKTCRDFSLVVCHCLPGPPQNNPVLKKGLLSDLSPCRLKLSLNVEALLPAKAPVSTWSPPVIAVIVQTHAMCCRVDTAQPC